MKRLLVKTALKRRFKLRELLVSFKLDRDGLHDLNVQGDWQKKNGTYWVRYVHVELLGHDSYGKTIIRIDW